MRAFTVFPDDWLAGTADLTTEESGAFWNLICHYMAKDGRVPDDDRVLSRVTKLTLRRWKNVKARLIDGVFLEVRDGFLHQEKCQQRLAKEAKFSTSQAEKAKKRWTSRSAKPLSAHETPNAGADAAAMPLLPTKILSPSEKGAGAPISSKVVKKEVTKTAATATDDLDAILFGSEPPGCLAYLVANGVADARARSLLGRWRKDHGNIAVLEVVAAAKRNGVSDPAPWIVAALKRRAPNRDTGGAFNPNLI